MLDLGYLVSKRDGTTEEYTRDKILSALRFAFKNTNTTDNSLLIEDIETEIKNNQDIKNSSVIDIEDIQNTVEKCLMNYKYYDAAKHYITYRVKRAEARKNETYVSKLNDDISPPWGPLGYVTYKRTYARRISEYSDNTEEFKGTILRVLDACQKQLNVGFTNQEIKDAYKYFMNLKCSVAGRFLWQLGTKTVDKLGLMSLQNCAFTNINEPIKPFLWIFDVLMLGTGVGFNIQHYNINKLPPLLNSKISITRLDTKDADFIVPDTREGWVSLLEKTLESYFYKGKSFTYSTILIRSKGQKINGFGGMSSGPEALVELISTIQKILNKRLGEKLTSVDCLDIINIIATCVVAGNTRRSALIAIGDPDDLEYLSAKRWDLGGIPNWRCMSNNSVNCSSIEQLPDEFWEGYKGNGEPYGLVNMELCKNIGRLKDGSKYPDPEVEGFNPCAEQNLADKETCCLAELFLPNINTFEELIGVTTVLYKICKHSLLLECHQSDTADIVHKNMRMGIGVTGYLQCEDNKKDWLSPLYEYLRELDKDYSLKLGCPISIKLTTCKPSGTLSILPGVTPGCHPGIYQYFIRRIRIGSDNPLIELCKRHGYKVEYQRNFDGSEDHNTMVVEFPCKYPDGTRLANNMSAIDQLNVVKELQTNWSDNAVSCTIYYRLNELESIKTYLRENYSKCIKSCSFLLHNEHGFDQAPYEEIGENHYNELINLTIPITSGNIQQADDDQMEVCKGGSCPLK